MQNEWFAAQDSIVRKIWGRVDTVLLVFAGSSAEFALNKAVDWLYFTGRLPADPLGRLFSTVAYAQRIVFARTTDALAAIDRINSIHAGVEASRGARIPDEAYLDVLFMLIDYSIRSYELLYKKLTEVEKAEVFDVFYRVGARMHLKGLPGHFRDWLPMRTAYLENDLLNSDLSRDLFGRYRKALGGVRYHLLLQVQILLAPRRVRKLLGLSSFSWMALVVPVYKLCRFLGIDHLIKAILLPARYKKQIAAIEQSARAGQ